MTESNWSKVEIVRHSPRDAGLYHEFLERDEKRTVLYVLEEVFSDPVKLPTHLRGVRAH